MTTPADVKVYWSKFQKTGTAWRFHVPFPDGTVHWIEIRAAQDCDMSIHTQWMTDQVLERYPTGLREIHPSACDLGSSWSDDSDGGEP